MTAAPEAPGASVFGDAFAYLLDLEPASNEPVTSEAVERHRSAFVRKWPEPVAASEDYVPAPVPPKTAVAVGRDELGDNRSARTQAVKAADEAGWSWRADRSSSPMDEGASSIVIRFALEDGATCRRAVAYWSAKPGKALGWVAGFAWDEAGGERSEYLRLSGAELKPHLRRGGLPPEDDEPTA